MMDAIALGILLSQQHPKWKGGEWAEKRLSIIRDANPSHLHLIG